MAYEQYVTAEVICITIIGMCIGVNLYWLCTWTNGFGRDTSGTRLVANLMRVIYLIVMVGLVSMLRDHLVTAAQPGGDFAIRQHYLYIVIALAGTMATLPFKLKASKSS